MTCSLDLKLVIKHLANGTIGENLCRLCLNPLTEYCENIFTRICKEDIEYCIADVLKDLCHIKISDADYYSVCSECFIASSNAYKFYLNTKRNEEVLHFYADQLEKYLQTINLSDDISDKSICISLPVVSKEIKMFDYNIKNHKVINEKSNHCKEISIKKEMAMNISAKQKKNNDDDEIIIIKDESGVSTYYKMQPNGLLEKIDVKDIKFLHFQREGQRKAVNNFENKKRKKREPMTSKKCMRCPIEYRFIAKLQEHMRMEHGVILYSCKICQALTEDEEFHNFHIKTHTSTYKCDICSVTFKKRDAILTHMRDHEVVRNKSELISDYVCLQCGLIFEDKEALSNHVDLNHYKKFACYYCGRIYKIRESFNKHVKKHEMYMKDYKERSKHQETLTFTTAEAKELIAQASPQPQPQSQHTCEMCGRSFRGARALLWHRRLHTNERPFVCDTCGRAFVSLNRRNQHALCAHTAPTRRCPLCPARFHLRAMVNTHVKKVHLKPHKRRVRRSAGAAAGEPVLVQELSVALQHRVLELQAAQNRDR